MPRDGTAVRVQVSKATAVVIGAPGGDAGAAAPADERPAELRLTSPTRLRPGAGHPPVRVPDRSPTRLRQRIARYVVVDQRTPLSERPDVW